MKSMNKLLINTLYDKIINIFNDLYTYNIKYLLIVAYRYIKNTDIYSKNFKLLKYT